MDRSTKEAWVAELNATLQDASFVAVTHYKGLSVKEMEGLRVKMREAGAAFRVTKNRLTRLALSGTKFEGLSDLMTGPTAIAYSEDPVAAAKVCADFAKGNEKLVIMGGSLDGVSLDTAGVQALAKMPSLDELRAKIVGMINTPATRIAGILGQPGASVARVISARAQQGEAA